MPKPASPPAPALPAVLSAGVAATGRVNKNVVEFNKTVVNISLGDIVDSVRRNANVPAGAAMKTAVLNNDVLTLIFEASTDRNVEDILK